MSRILDLVARWKPGRTFAQTLAAALIADGTGLLDTDWGQRLSVSGMAGLVSWLMIWAQGQAAFAEPAVAYDGRHDGE